MHVVHRAPWNTFRHGDFFQLRKFKVPALGSPTVACAAALFRTATRTIPHWPKWIEQLKIAAHENLPFSRTHGEKVFYPSCWDSPSFAHNLQWAYEGFSGSGRFESAGHELRNFFGGERGCMPLPGSDTFIQNGSLQKKVHKIMMNKAVAEDEVAQLSSLARTRIGNLFAPFQIDFDCDVNLELAFGLLKHLQPVTTTKVIKTWLNGWATSHRMKEEVVHPCLLGCAGCKDSLKHYIMSPHLFAFCNYFFKADPCPLRRFAIKESSILNLKILACVFSAYHAVKGQVRSGIITMHENAETYRKTWSVFADALAAEAGECHIQFVSFSLSKFTCFLTNGALPPDQLALHHQSQLILHEDTT